MSSPVRTGTKAPDGFPTSYRELRGKVDSGGKGYHDDFMNAPLDVDGDGNLDVVSCCWFAKRMEWYRNPGAKGGLWTMAAIENPGNHECGDLWDVDGDGAADEVVPSTRDTTWFGIRKGADGRQILARHVVSSDNRPLGSGVGDVNGDGRPDILRPTAWYEAPADPETGQWVAHGWKLGAKDGGTTHTAQMLVYDVDADGLNDVITSDAHKHGIFWYRQTRNGAETTWVQHTIDDSWSQAHSLSLADLDQDGDLDLVTGKRFMAHNGNDPDSSRPLGVYWYALERGKTPAWKKHALTYDEGIGSGLNVCTVDLDGDGDTDIVVTGKWAGPVWFENKLK